MRRLKLNFINFVKDVNSIDFITPKENLHLEFKEAAWSLPKNIWDTVSSFSNTDGGLIVLGIAEPKSHHYKIVGVDQPDEVKKQLFNDNNNPSVINKPVIRDEDVTFSNFDGKTLIQIKIYPAQFLDKPIINEKNKTAYMRSDDGDRPATPDQLKYLYAESQYTVDTRLLKNYDWETDLNLQDIDKYRANLIRLKHEGYEKETNKQLLIDLGVLRRDRRTSSNKLEMTEGGLLFLGNFTSITDRFPRFQLDYTRFQNDGDTDWIDRVSAGDMNYPNLNIYSFYNIVLPKITANINDKYIQDSQLTRGSYFSDLKLAAKEALVNCLMHAYYDGTVAVKVEDRPSYWEFSNPGDMRVSKESFLRGQKSSIRNPEIATLFRRIGISEKQASGGPRILRAASRNHLMEPEINVDPENKTTTIRIWKINIKTKIGDQYKLDQTEKFIINYAIRQPQFKFGELYKATNNKYGSNSTVRKKFNNLINRKIIVSEGNGRATIYKLDKTNEQKQVDKIIAIKEIEKDL